MRKFISLLLSALLLMTTLLTGCGTEKESGPYVYYLNLEGTKLVTEKCTIKGDSVEEKMQNLLDLLQSTPESGDNRQTIPNSVEVQNIDFNGYLASIDFNAAYNKMSVTEEVLVRAAIVRTLTQIDEVTLVLITVDNSPLMDQDGNYIGSMSKDSFVENPGAQINSSINTTLTLYFASADGKSLVKETRNVKCSSSVSMEKVVIKQLLDGPKSSNLQATLPSETKLISISTVDSVCYVNFDENFQNQNESIAEEVVLYSIVDSLTELADVESVQISINGDTSKKVRYLCDLSQKFTFDSKLLIDDSDTERTEATDTEIEETTETEETTDVNTNAGVSDVLNQSTP